MSDHVSLLFQSQMAVLSKFIQMAQLCADVRNFATCLSVLGGLENLIVRQLPIWKNLPAKCVSTMEQLATLKVCTTQTGRKEGNVLFNDALHTFYLRLYGVRHMVKDHSDSERGNLLSPHGLLFPFNSKGSFICIILQTG